MPRGARRAAVTTSLSRVNELRDDELTCPRCGDRMDRGDLNAGKGPLRWVSRPDQHATVLGGELLAPRKLLWGRRVVPAARCERCRVGSFTYGEQ